ncbi:MAG TPA: hypothetical protein VIK89_04505 [Cytophagaceae bacterium]
MEALITRIVESGIGSTIPVVNPLRLKNYDFRNGVYVVYLDYSNKREFSTREQAEQFLNDTSYFLNLQLHCAVVLYSELCSLTQCHVLSFEHKKYRQYNELKQTIEDEIYFIKVRYSGQSNHVYFKKLHFIYEKIFTLAKLCSGFPAVNLKSLETKLNLRIHELH